MITNARNAENWRLGILFAGASLLFAASCPAQESPAAQSPPEPAPAQKPAEAPANAAQQPVAVSQTIKKESRLVLVDTVVTDKKGN